jgi:hypothetical protein
MAVMDFSAFRVLQEAFEIRNSNSWRDAEKYFLTLTLRDPQECKAARGW